MKHNITVEKLKELGACEEGIEKFEKVNRELTKLNPEFYLWVVNIFQNILIQNILTNVLKKTHGQHCVMYLHF